MSKSEQIFKSKVGFGPRGEYFHYVVVEDGKITGFGDEQGNYAGGLYATPDFNESGFLNGKEELKTYYPELYEQIKDIPLAKVYRPQNHALYRPQGKAGEYAKWAVNFYTGCSNNCDYCYCKRGVLSRVWSIEPKLKKCFKDEKDALAVFEKEFNYQCRKEDLKRDGIFFSFTTDPLLPSTGGLTLDAALIALRNGVPSTILTKRADGAMLFVECYSKLLRENDIYRLRFSNLAIGFTLTGHDELERGASSNEERINAMRYIHSLGIKTFASIEPIIDFEGAAAMITCTLGFCDLYKIGLLSGCKRPDVSTLTNFVEDMTQQIGDSGAKVYWKDSVSKELGSAMFKHPAIVASDYSLFRKGSLKINYPNHEGIYKEYE